MMASSASVSGIFISYRRREASGFAGRLYDHLARTYGADRVFIDVDSIEPGLNFSNVIVNAVDRSAVILVIIGPSWVDISDQYGRRQLDNIEDPVRVEIRTALTRKIPIIPVLIDSTPMPAREPLPIDIQQFVQCNAIRLRHESFDSGIKRLVKVLEGYMTEPPLRTFRNHALTMKAIIVTSLVLCILVVFGLIWLNVI